MPLPPQPWLSNTAGAVAGPACQTAIPQYSIISILFWAANDWVLWLAWRSGFVNKRSAWRIATPGSKREVTPN